MAQVLVAGPPLVTGPARRVGRARVTNHTVDRRPEGVVTCEPPKPGA
jgi:hypothetical protein